MEPFIDQFVFGGCGRVSARGETSAVQESMPLVVCTPHHPYGSTEDLVRVCLSLAHHNYLTDTVWLYWKCSARPRYAANNDTFLHDNIEVAFTRGHYTTHPAPLSSIDRELIIRGDRVIPVAVRSASAALV
jgi:hypothetical protein